MELVFNGASVITKGGDRPSDEGEVSPKDHLIGSLVFALLEGGGSVKPEACCDLDGSYLFWNKRLGNRSPRSPERREADKITYSEALCDEVVASEDRSLDRY